LCEFCGSILLATLDIPATPADLLSLDAKEAAIHTDRQFGI